MTLSLAEINQLRYNETTEGVLPALRQRWSPRSFLDQEVPQASLRRLFEAARWAASSGNSQPWRYFLGLRNSATHQKIASALAGYNKDWAPRATLILGTADTLSSKSTPNPYALYDLGAASAILTLQAVGEGLAAHQMGGFDHEVIRKALDIPEQFALGSVIAVGYQTDPAVLSDETLITREITPRHRKPLSELVFTAHGEPADLG